MNWPPSQLSDALQSKVVGIIMGCWKHTDIQHQQPLKGTNRTKNWDSLSENTLKASKMVKVWGKFFLKALLSWKPSRGMDGMYFKHFSTAVEGSSRLLCSHICELDSWMLRENYSLICGEPDWTAASPYTIQTLPLRLIKDWSFLFFFLQWLGQEIIHGWSQFRLVDRSSQICRLNVSYQKFLEWSQAEQHHNISQA